MSVSVRVFFFFFFSFRSSERLSIYSVFINLLILLEGIVGEQRTLVLRVHLSRLQNAVLDSESETWSIHLMGVVFCQPIISFPNMKLDIRNKEKEKKPLEPSKNDLSNFKSREKLSRVDKPIWGIFLIRQQNRFGGGWDWKSTEPSYLNTTTTTTTSPSGFWQFLRISDIKAQFI